MSGDIVIKAFKHFNLICKHRWEVFKLCCRAGIPFRGLVHDLSKCSPTEFFESAKYYNGNISPITIIRERKGYSKAWLHHKGRNKHHAEYWYDPAANESTPIIPYKYTVEMICDNLAANITYNKKKWNKNLQIIYWNERKKEILMNQKNIDMLTEVYTQISKVGIEKTIKKSNLKKLYHKYCE